MLVVPAQAEIRFLFLSAHQTRKDGELDSGLRLRGGPGMGPE